MKIYICGKVTGLPYKQVRDKFNEAEQKLKGMGFTPVNPVQFVPEACEWNTAMKICISRLIDCDAIFLLPDYKQSKGAMLEYEIAKALDFKIISFGGTCEYEVMTPPLPVVPFVSEQRIINRIISEDELIAELENSQEQIYSLCRSIELEFKIQAVPEDVAKMIPVFAREVADQGMLPIQLREAKRYFSNWLKNRIKNKQNGQVNNNGKRANGVTDGYKERLAKDLLAECNAGNTTES